MGVLLYPPQVLRLRMSHSGEKALWISVDQVLLGKAIAKGVVCPWWSHCNGDIWVCRRPARCTTIAVSILN